MRRSVRNIGASDRIREFENEILGKEVRKVDRVRKIQPVVRKVTFTEAEEADHAYWAKATAVERFNELVNLRVMVFGDDTIERIEKVVRKRYLYEEAD